MNEEPRNCKRCEVNPELPLHECPYKAEIDDNHEFCNCCDDCRYECSMEI